MDTLQISGKWYISTRRAAKENGYHADYIGQLIRSEKVKGQKVGRSWYVLADSLAEYLETEKKSEHSVLGRRKHTKSKTIVPEASQEEAKPKPIEAAPKISVHEVTKEEKPAAPITPVKAAEEKSIPAPEAATHKVIAPSKNPALVEEKLMTYLKEEEEKPVRDTEEFKIPIQNNVKAVFTPEVQSQPEPVLKPILPKVKGTVSFHKENPYREGKKATSFSSFILVIFTGLVVLVLSAYISGSIAL